MSAHAPFNRESFLTAQRRNRRSTWRLSVLCYGAAVLVSIAISMLLSPLLLSLLVLITDLLSLAFPVANLGGIFWSFIDRLVDHPETLAWSQILMGALIATAPGLLLALVSWVGLRRLFAHMGAAAVMDSIGGREPDSTDLEERQLVNVVEEMALAANIRPPRVALYVDPRINGAAVGRRPDEAVVLVSRGALDGLNRAETQGLCGHLIAAVSNDDVRIGGLVISVLQLCGLVRVLASAPFELNSRRLIRDLLRSAFGRRVGSSGAGQSVDLMTLLVAFATLDEERSDASTSDTSTKLKLIDWLRMPFMPANLIGAIMLPMLTSFLLLPLFALSWRARRYLADATAVQLTRDPESLAQALTKLRGAGSDAPGPDWVRHLFVAAGSGPSFIAFHPSIERRLTRLQRMGASVDLRAPRPSTRLVLLAVLVLGPLLLLLLVLFATVLYLMGLVSVMLSMLFLLPVVGLLHLLMRGWR